MNHPKTLPSTYQAGISQSKAYRALSNFMTAYLKQFGLSEPEWKVLGLLHENSYLSPSDISQVLGVKTPIATRLLKSLENKKLIKRKDGLTDNRTVAVSLSPSGNRLAKNLEQKLRIEMGRFLSDIDRPELEIYLKVINKLADKL